MIDLWHFGSNTYDTLMEAWLDGQKINAIKSLRQLYRSPKGVLLGLKAAKESFEQVKDITITDHELFLMALNMTVSGNPDYRARVIFKSANVERCEECDARFEPKPPSYAYGWSTDTHCESCCDNINEAQFMNNEMRRCGG